MGPSLLASRAARQWALPICALAPQALCFRRRAVTRYGKSLEQDVIASPRGWDDHLQCLRTSTLTVNLTLIHDWAPRCGAVSKFEGQSTLPVRFRLHSCAPLINRARRRVYSRLVAWHLLFSSRA